MSQRDDANLSKVQSTSDIPCTRLLKMTPDA
jgi:hypothetical protein